MATTSAFDVAAMPAARAVEVIRRGLPARAFTEVANAVMLTQQEFAQKVGIVLRTYRSLQQKGRRLSPETSEKLVRAARVHRLARKVFQTDAAASQWLASPAPALSGTAPIDLLDTEVGAREVESVLQGMAYGNVM